MRKRNVFFILSLLIIIVSCNSLKNEQENKILKISYSRYGGKVQSITELEITEDSIFYQTGKLESKKMYREKTSKELWQELSKVNLKAFDKIESTKSVIEVDDKDEKVSITTNTKVHSFLNGRIINSTEIKHFLALLHQQMSKMTEPSIM